MSEQTYLLSFTEVSQAEANEYAEELREIPLDSTIEITAQRQRKNSLAQDLGTVLVLIMGKPAFVAEANGIGSWLQRFCSASLTILTAENKMVVENLVNKDVAHLLQLFLTQMAFQREPSP